MFKANRQWSRVFAICLALAVLVELAGWRPAAADQTVFDNKRQFDATQCMAVDEERMVEKKNRFLAVFAENKCSRPIHGLACFKVTRPSLKFSRNGWYCNFHEYKSRSRQLISEHAQYARVKKWAACNFENEECSGRLRYIEGVVNSSGRDPEDVAGR